MQIKGIASVVVTALAATTFGSCSQGTDHTSDNVIYSCSEYTVYTDSVVQGEFTARAVSPTEITTDYKSTLTSGASPVVDFRFSINSRDNEMGKTYTHHATIGKTDDFVYTFGTTEGDPARDEKAGADTLVQNAQWTIRVDMRHMLRAFDRDGFYVTPTGDKIFANDFKGLWIAGSVDPLSWDFENLYGKHDRKFKDRGDSIFELTLTVNPPKEISADPAGWKIDGPNLDYPQYSSDQMLADAIYNMGIAEIASNIRPDEAFRAGKEWDGVWTRDVAYSIYLSLSYLDPARSINSLKAKVKNDRIIQDTGTGGAWPVSSDRVVWAMAAWEIYKVTGDHEWLQYSYNVVRNTLADDKLVVWNPEFSLNYGEQSYLDWREQTYPHWMEPIDIFESMCLGTNVMAAEAYHVLGEMTEELGLDDDEAEEMHDAIKDGINDHLWIPNRGYYSEYLYGAVYPIQSQVTDNLGQALSIIFDIATPEMAESIMRNTPRVVFGTPSVTPQQADTKPYHNNAVWPFVQAYWNIAAARTNNVDALCAGLAAIYRAGAMFSTHKELFVASNGDYRGTAINSDSQLWSCAGAVAMTYRVLAGMEFETDGIEFNPYIPEMFAGAKKITGFKYRNAVIDIEIDGTGNNISAFDLDGTVRSEHKLPADLVGHHTLRITMANNPLPHKEINVGPQLWMPSTPVIDWTDAYNAKIDNFIKGTDYMVYVNGVANMTTSSSTFTVDNTNVFTVVGVVPHSGTLNTSGFMPRPHSIIPQGSETEVEATAMGTTGTSYIKDRKIAAEYIELTTTRNTSLTFDVEVPQSGTYCISFVYANGMGPINTDNRCAIRTLFVNDSRVGAVVMPQRGIEEWLSVGNTNTLQAKLNAGKNTISLRYVTPYNVNMNGDVNTALIKSMRLIRK